MSRFRRPQLIDRCRSSALTLWVLLVLAPLALSATGCARRSKQCLCTEILTHVRESYVENVDEKTLRYGGIRGLLQTLDPYSAFLPSEVFSAVQEDVHGLFGGIGVELDQRHDTLIVVSSLPDTPAAHADIRAGDCILAVDGDSVVGSDRTAVAARLRGDPGTEVTLTLSRRQTVAPFEIHLVREEIRIDNVQTRRLPGDFGYVRLIQFRDNAEADLREALAGLHAGNSRPLAGLIFDLRSNPGGRFDQAVKVADLFLERGLIVHTVGRGEGKNTNYMAHQRGTEPNIPMVILVNEGTASAAEIVAGALQDHQRARLFGTRTYGKGSMQTLIPLTDGSGLRLTTARYITPDGVSIEATGLVPDVEVPGGDGAQPTDFQLLRALEYLKGIHPRGGSLAAAE